MGDPHLVEDLRELLERLGFSVQPTDDDAIEVEMSGSFLTERAARRELRSYLGLWKLLHPLVDAEVIGPASVSRPLADTLAA